MATTYAIHGDPYITEWVIRGRSLLADRMVKPHRGETKAEPNITKKRAPISGRSTDQVKESKVEIVEKPTAVPEVNLARPIPPNVTNFEAAIFFLWSFVVIAVQAWRDFIEKRPFLAVLATDSMSHYYYIPMGRREPRVLTTGPYNKFTTKYIPPTVTRRFEEDYDLESLETFDFINCASNNYGGFSQLEFGAEKAIASALQKLPFAPAPPDLETQVRRECAAYMECEACVTAPSGFSTNVLAFGTVAGVARNLGRKMVFICDRDCHNSMFTGAYLNQEARTHKFDHNDLTDLEYKLRMYREQDPSAFVCVAIEGIYSMEGSVNPVPAILALKKAYKFYLLVDEAHSFMALGSKGRGSFNHWEDAGYECPTREVDVMSCMFSKSVGCTGGFVLANGLFAPELQKQGKELELRGVETLSSIVLLRILGLLRKPLLIQHRMHLVHQKANYVAQELKKAGCRILSAPGSAIVCFSVGTYRQVVRFHTEATRMGVAISGAGPPATPLWGCRIRMCIFATTSWPDIHRLMKMIVHVGHKTQVDGIKPITFDPSLDSRTDPIDPTVEKQCDAVDEDLLRYVDELSLIRSRVDGKTSLTKEDVEVVEAGVQGLQKYGIGPCSARWFYGSFDIFIQLERRLASLYPSILAQSGKCRAMICGDAEITIGSTLTALAMPCSGRNILNRVLVPINAPRTVMAGAKLNKPSKSVPFTFYHDVNSIPSEIAKFSPSKFHMTLYLQTVIDGVPLDLVTLLKATVPALRQTRRLTGLTIMFDDRNGLGKLGPQSLGFLNLMEAEHGVDFLATLLRPLGCPTQVLVAGSWFDAFGHQGGYVTGTASTVECLTWDAKAFFFSTPPMPLQAAMSDRKLRLLLEGRKEAGNGEDGV